DHLGVELAGRDDPPGLVRSGGYLHHRLVGTLADPLGEHVVDVGGGGQLDEDRAGDLVHSDSSGSTDRACKDTGKRTPRGAPSTVATLGVRTWLVQPPSRRLARPSCNERT